MFLAVTFIRLSGPIANKQTRHRFIHPVVKLYKKAIMSIFSFTAQSLYIIKIQLLLHVSVLFPAIIRHYI